MRLRTGSSKSGPDNQTHTHRLSSHLRDSIWPSEKAKEVAEGIVESGIDWQGVFPATTAAVPLILSSRWRSRSRPTGGWTGVIYEAGGESALKGTTSRAAEAQLNPIPRLVTMKEGALQFPTQLLSLNSLHAPPQHCPLSQDPLPPPPGQSQSTGARTE